MARSIHKIWKSKNNPAKDTENAKEMQKRVLEVIKKNNLIEFGESVLIGLFSGGTGFCLPPSYSSFTIKRVGY